MYRVKKTLPYMLACLVLAALCLGVYWPVLDQDFINYDDPLYVTQNSFVSRGLNRESAAWAFNVGYSSNWHPVTWLSHMLDVELHGLKPGMHKLTNVLLHTANSILLFLILLRLLPRGPSPHSQLSFLPQLPGVPWSHDPIVLWSSFFIASLFAVHPLHVESVAWVSERKDVLSAFFFMLTLLAYGSYVTQRSTQKTIGLSDNRTIGRGHKKTKGPPDVQSSMSHSHSPVVPWSYCLALAFFALGLMSKPMLVTVPFVLLLLDFWPLGRLQFPFKKAHLPIYVEKLPFMALTAGSCVLTLIAQRPSLIAQEALPFGIRLSNAATSYAIYLWQTVWPVNLAPFYQYRGLSTGLTLASTAILIVVTVAVVLSLRKRGWFFTGWFWYLGMLVPVIGLVQVGMQAHADRYTYLPHIGIFMLIVWSLSALAPSRPRFAGLGAAAGFLVIAALAVRAHDQVKLWKDSKTLFTHAVQLSEDNFHAWQCLGIADLHREDPDSALTNFAHALEASRSYGAEPSVKYFVGIALQLQGKMVEAIPLLEEGKALPEQRDEQCYRRGLSYLEAERFAEAEQSFRNALALEPHSVDSRLGLARSLAKLGKLEEAERIAREVAAQNPTQAKPNHALASFLMSTGRPAEARSFYEAAMKDKPEDLKLARDYSKCLGALGQVTNALAILERVLKLEPQNIDSMLELAAVFDDGGQDREAVELYRKALSIEPSNVGALNNLAWLLSTTPDDQARNGGRAIELARQACGLTDWKEPVLIGTLAAAHAEAGQFPEAVANAEKARAIALEQNQTQVANRNAELLEMYKAGKPFREKN